MGLYSWGWTEQYHQRVAGVAAVLLWGLRSHAADQTHGPLEHDDNFGPFCAFLLYSARFLILILLFFCENHEQGEEVIMWGKQNTHLGIVYAHIYQRTQQPIRCKHACIHIYICLHTLDIFPFDQYKRFWGMLLCYHGVPYVPSYFFKNPLKKCLRTSDYFSWIILFCDTKSYSELC